MMGRPQVTHHPSCLLSWLLALPLPHATLPSPPSTTATLLKWKPDDSLLCLKSSNWLLTIKHKPWIKAFDALKNATPSLSAWSPSFLPLNWSSQVQTQTCMLYSGTGSPSLFAWWAACQVASAGVTRGKPEAGEALLLLLGGSSSQLVFSFFGTFSTSLPTSRWPGTALHGSERGLQRVAPPASSPAPGSRSVPAVIITGSFQQPSPPTPSQPSNLV